MNRNKKYDLSDYKKRLHTVNMKRITFFSLVLTAVGVGGFVLINIYAGPKIPSSPWWMWLAGTVATFFFFFVHEILHAAAFIFIGGSKTQDIKFGCNFAQGFLYCTSVRPLKRNAYIVTILFPFIVTFLAGLALSLFQGHLAWPIAAGILLGGCGGDVVMAGKVARMEKGALMLDHPNAPAYYELIHKDDAPEDFREITPEEESALEINPETNGKQNKILAWILLVTFTLIAVAIIYAIITLIKG